MRLGDGTPLESIQNELTFYANLNTPLAPGGQIEASWTSSRTDSMFRNVLWLSGSHRKAEWSGEDSLVDGLGEFAQSMGDFSALMHEWINDPSIRSDPDRLRETAFFHGIESKVHPRAECNHYKLYTETLTDWLRMRNRERMLEAREGRPLGGSPQSRLRESQPLPADVYEASRYLEPWLFEQVVALAGGSERPEEQAAALGRAFDNFCAGRLRWLESVFGVPDSTNVILFAEMAILFRQMGFHSKLWLQALPSLIRGIEIFQEIVWSGARRDTESYNLRNYDASDSRGRKVLSSFPERRLNNLRHYYAEERLLTAYRRIALEYRLGCICLHMLQDDMALRDLDESNASISCARSASIGAYIDDQVDNPIRIPPQGLPS